MESKIRSCRKVLENKFCSASKDFSMQCFKMTAIMKRLLGKHYAIKQTLLWKVLVTLVR